MILDHTKLITFVSSSMSKYKEVPIIKNRAKIPNGTRIENRVLNKSSKNMKNMLSDGKHLKMMFYFIDNLEYSMFNNDSIKETDLKRSKYFKKIISDLDKHIDFETKKRKSKVFKYKEKPRKKSSNKEGMVQILIPILK